jgi:hypothetical protein
MQGFPKRNTQHRRGKWLSCARPGIVVGLSASPGRQSFDRDGQSRYQPRDFVEPVGVMVLNHSREPGETLVIAHRRRLGWNEGWDRVIGMKDGHRINSRSEPGGTQPRPGIRRFGVRFVTRTDLDRRCATANHRSACAGNS